MEKKSKYYAVRSKPLAYGIKFLTGQSFYKYNDDETGAEIYSFIKTDNFNEAMTMLFDSRDKINKK